jgi:hypothetical protein
MKLSEVQHKTNDEIANEYLLWVLNAGAEWAGSIDSFCVKVERSKTTRGEEHETWLQWENHLRIVAAIRQLGPLAFALFYRWRTVVPEVIQDEDLDFLFNHAYEHIYGHYEPIYESVS